MRSKNQLERVSQLGHLGSVERGLPVRRREARRLQQQVSISQRLTLGTPTALADFRAVYGGISFGIAAFAIIGIRQPKVTLSAVWLLTLTMDGLIFGRLVSTVVSGPGNIVIFGQLGLEVFAAAWDLLLIRAARAAQASQLSSSTAAPAGA